MNYLEKNVKRIEVLKKEFKYATEEEKVIINDKIKALQMWNNYG